MIRKFSLSTVAVGAAAMFCVPATADTPKISGRVMLDYNLADADTADLDVSSGEARRIRLGVSGNFSDSIGYKAELNTDSSGEVSATDVYLDFKFAQGWKVRAGQMKTPNSLDELTSSRFISTHERGAFTDAFGLDRRLGVMAMNSGDQHTFSVGVFGENLDAGAADGGTAIAARGTYAFDLGEDDLIHVGGSVRYREQGDDSGLIRYRQRPYAHIPGRAISTGSIADSDTFVGLEAAAVISRFWAAAEIAQTNADCALCTGGEMKLQGHYLEAGVFLNGRRAYSGGKFDRPDVDKALGEDGGFGALALVARVDSIDQNADGVDGGELDTLVIGADWWPTDRVRLGINAFWSEVSLGTSTSGLDPAFASQVLLGTQSDDVSGAVVRLQFDY